MLKLRNEYPRPHFKRDEWLSLNGKWEFEFDDNNNKTYFKFVGGDLHWKYIEDQLKLAYDYKIINYEEGKERSQDPKNPLDQPTKEVVVEVEIYNPVTVKDFKSKYYVGNGKLNTKIDN